MTEVLSQSSSLRDGLQVVSDSEIDISFSSNSQTPQKTLSLEKTEGGSTGSDSGRGSLDASPTEEKLPVLYDTSSSPQPVEAPVELHASCHPAPIYHTHGPDVVVEADSVTSWCPDLPVKLRLRDSGVHSLKPVSIPTVMSNTVKRIPNHPALAHKRDGQWLKWTYQQYYADVVRAAKSLIELGLEPYHGVGIIGFNSPEWFISNLAAIFAGGLATGIYTTNSAEACHFVADNCKANVIIVENGAQLAKVVKVWDRLPHLKAVVQYSDELKEKKDNVYSWLEFLELGKTVSDDTLQTRIKNQAPNKCCTLIYTSGTTGNPKGVMLSHDNVSWTANMAGRAATMQFGEEHLISYLPLSHIAAQIVDIYGPIIYGGTVWFAQPDALKGTLGVTMKEVRPTVFLGVPRVWEKIQEKMQALGARTTGIKKKIAVWAKDIGLRGNLSLMEGQLKGKKSRGSVPFGWTIANAVVFKKIRAALGLDRCKVCISAAAPITRETLTYFMSLNIPVTEIYGMSECTGPHTVSFPWQYRLGSCGQELPGVSTKLDNQDAEGNGEVCMAGRHVFMGYIHEEAKTKDTIDESGWLHSGDIGRIDDKGFMYITGRIKELIITAGGENVAPVPIEDTLKEECPIISNCMLIGDKRKFLSILLTLKCEVDPNTLEPLDELTSVGLSWCHSVGSSATTVSTITATKDEAIFTAIQAAVDRANKRAESNAKRIAKWTILPKDFSVAGGELGPTLKLKRPVVHKMYDSTIQALYGGL